jgi:hypothetical protein
LEKKMQKPPRYSGTASTPVRKEALAAIEEIAASDLAMEQELADLTGNPATPREERDYLELVALDRSLDGPEHRMSTLGYSRAVYPAQRKTRDIFEG